MGIPVWTRSNDHGNAWRRGVYRITGVNNPYRIVFEGVVGSSYDGVNNLLIF